MAVDLTQLAAALRLGDGVTAPTEPVAGILSRLMGVSEAFVELQASFAPAAVQDEAVVRMVAYLYDAPTAARGDRYAAAWRNSGAESLVSRWVERRADGGEGEPIAVGIPVSGGLNADQVNELIRLALDPHEEQENVHHTPPEIPQGQDLDESAVTAVVRTIVEDWAETDRDVPIPKEEFTEHDRAVDSHEDIRLAGAATDDKTATLQSDVAALTPRVTGLEVAEADDATQIAHILADLLHPEKLPPIAGVLGSSQTTVRYSLSPDLNGDYNFSVRLNLRADIGQSVTNTLTMRLSVSSTLDGIPDAHFDFQPGTRDKSFVFSKRGVAVTPGLHNIDFAVEYLASVTAVHFRNVEDLDYSALVVTGGGEVAVAALVAVKVPLVAIAALALTTTAWANTLSFLDTGAAYNRGDWTFGTQGGRRSIVVPSAGLYHITSNTYFVGTSGTRNGQKVRVSYIRAGVSTVIAGAAFGYYRGLSTLESSANFAVDAELEVGDELIVEAQAVAVAASYAVNGDNQGSIQAYRIT